MDDSDKQEMRALMEKMVRLAESRRGTGQIDEVTFQEVGDRKVLAIALEIHSPGENLWMRQYKFKEAQSDHLIGLYVKSKASADQMESVLNRFVQSYRSTVKP